MAYPLQSLLKIRAMREDRASTTLTVARRARVNAAEMLARKREDCAQYEKTKDERRDRVYEAVMGRPVKREALDRVREAVSRIDEEGFLLLEAERKAQDVLTEKSQEESKAHVHYVAATRERTKIDLHRDIWIEDDRREQELAADAEMEEFAGKRISEDA